MRPPRAPRQVSNYGSWSERSRDFDRSDESDDSGSSYDSDGMSQTSSLTSVT